MKNIEASVGVVPTQEQKARDAGEIEEEEYTQMENEMIFFLADAPEYQISAVGRWLENSEGEVIGDVDTYFRHILTGERCESAWGCLIGWSEQDERVEEKWETLCMRIEELQGLDQIICDEKSFGV